MNSGYALKVVLVLNMFVVLFITTANAGKRYVLVSGKWQSETGCCTINENDTVQISGYVMFRMPVQIKGVLLIDSGASLAGIKRIWVMAGGTVFNRGNLVAKEIFNEGTYHNSGITDLMYQMENRGNLINNSLINCAETFKHHIGVLQGSGGYFYAGTDILINPSIVYDTATLHFKVAR
jgi:hypothetical protein